MCHTRQASHHHAERYPAGQKDPRRESLKLPKQQNYGPFRTTNSSKGRWSEKLPIKCISLQKKKATHENKEIKLFTAGNALSKQIPLKINGFVETRSFPHLLR